MITAMWMRMRTRMMKTTAATSSRMRARKNYILSSYFVICLDESRRDGTEGPVDEVISGDNGDVTGLMCLIV